MFVSRLNPDQTRQHLARTHQAARRTLAILLAIVLGGLLVAFVTRRILFHVVFQSP